MSEAAFNTKPFAETIKLKKKYPAASTRKINFNYYGSQKNRHRSNIKALQSYITG